ncbi:hypothetical protein ACFQPG_03085 [Sphingomonas sp. GCM10030256]|uniref:hypothetical protein n=1 Tax=Sphingomonas sp. GCM10030256 TaxID=3273427 RepID=UPI00361B65B9
MKMARRGGEFVTPCLHNRVSPAAVALAACRQIFLNNVERLTAEPPKGAGVRLTMAVFRARYREDCEHSQPVGSGAKPIYVIASMAKQSSSQEHWIASSLRSSQWLISVHARASA